MQVDCKENLKKKNLVTSEAGENQNTEGDFIPESKLGALTLKGDTSNPTEGES